MRRRGGGSKGAAGGEASQASLTPMTPEDVEAMIMCHLKGKMDDMERLASRVDELEREAASAQSEIEGLRSKVGALEGRCNCEVLEHRVGYLEKTVQISVTEHDNRNTYVHKMYEPPNRRPPIIPKRHWQDLGFDEDYADSMVRFMRDLRAKSYGLRTGVSYTEINLGNEEWVTEDDATVLLHDDILLPNWREFADSLRLCHYSESGRFLLTNVQLTQEVLHILAPSMATKQFHSWTLDRNEFVNVREGIDFAVKSAKDISTLEYFRWKNNPIPHLNDANHLVNAICEHPCVSSIGIVNSCADSGIGYNILRSILAKQDGLLHIDMASNNIRTLGGTHVSDFLGTNPALKTLRLSKNNLNDVDAILIAQALKQNTNLEELHLGQNDIESAGRAALQKSIYDSTSIKAVASSNHTCVVYGVAFEIDNEEGWPYDGSKNKGRKTRLFLYSEGRDGSIVNRLHDEFDEDSLQLAPKVLSYIGRGNSYYYRTTKSQRLSCLFEILRGWQMPDLFNNRRRRQ